MSSKSRVLSAFASQTGKHSSGSQGRSGQTKIFYEDRILYSFGRHFPLAIKAAPNANEEGFGSGIQYIINGDKYSVSTAQHQNEAISTLKPNVQIPFSALEQAWEWTTKKAYNLPWKLTAGDEEFKIVNYRKDTWAYQCQEEKTGKPLTEWMDSDSAAWKAHTCQRDVVTRDQATHRLGAVLFTIQSETFLSSFDEQDTRNYFLCQVPGSPQTIEEAYGNLKPKLIKACDNLGLSYLRQGDWFFVQAHPIPELPNGEQWTNLAVVADLLKLIRQGKTQEVKDFRLGGISGTHKVTRMRPVPGSLDADGNATGPYEHVQGIVRHSPTNGRPPEHRRLKLGDGKSWWIPVKNTSLASWGVVGNVD